MSPRASVVRPAAGWVATVRGNGDWREAQKALSEACAKMRGDGVDVTDLDVLDTQAAAHVPRVVRRPS